MKVLLSAFQCRPGHGSEPGNGWHWATSLAESGHEVTVLTSTWDRDAILEADQKNVDFRFIEVPPSPVLDRLWPRLGVYRSYRRWQESALRYSENFARQYDVAHHVTWASLHLGSRLWRLPIPFVYGPIQSAGSPSAIMNLTFVAPSRRVAAAVGVFATSVTAEFRVVSRLRAFSGSSHRPNAVRSVSTGHCRPK
jgi:hypothetical protein